MGLSFLPYLALAPPVNYPVLTAGAWHMVFLRGIEYSSRSTYSRILPIPSDLTNKLLLRAAFDGRPMKS